MDGLPNPFVYPPQGGALVDVDQLFPIGESAVESFPEGPLYDDGDIAPMQTMYGMDVGGWLVDIPEFLRRTDTPPQLPDASEFAREMLATKPGMAWLAEVETILIQPAFLSQTDQREQLTRFTEHLLAEAVTVDARYFPRNPDYTPSPLLAVDTETTGLDLRTRYDHEGRLVTRTLLVGVTVATSGFKGYYLPVRNTGDDGIPNWDPDVIAEWLGTLNETFLCAMHNAGYDLEVMGLNGVSKFRSFPYCLDTQICDYLQDVGEKRHGLKATAERRLSRKMVEIAELFVGIGGIKKNAYIAFEHLSASQALVYACSDSLNTYALLQLYLNMSDHDNVFLTQPLPELVDQRLQHTIRNMLRPGLPVNYAYMYYAAKDAIYRLVLIEQRIYGLAGREFNIGSQDQLNEVLFHQFQIQPLPKAERNKKGLYSLDEANIDALLELNPQVEILSRIVTYRKLVGSISKLYLKAVANTYVDAFLPWTRVRLGFSQTTVDTGRLSSSSTGSKERVSVKQNKKSLGYKYERGSGEAGFNSQGIPSHAFRTAKARRIRALPAAAGLNLDRPYPDEVERRFIQGLAAL